MPRKRVVTRTIKTYDYDVLVADLVSEKTFRKTYSLGFEPKSFRTVLSQVAKLEGDAKRPLKVMGKSSRIVKYEMPLNDFLAHAVMVSCDGDEDREPDVAEGE